MGGCVVVTADFHGKSSCLSLLESFVHLNMHTRIHINFLCVFTRCALVALLAVSLLDNVEH